MQRKILAGAVLILLVALGAWAFGLFGGTDPAVAELQQMAAQAFSPGATDAQRDQFRDQFRQRMGQLTPQQREAFFDANRDQWAQRAEQRMDEFFQLPPADQQKRLDEMLNRMSQSRSNGRQARRNEGGDRRGGRNMTEAQRDERSKRRLDRTSPKMRAQMTEFRKRLEDRAKQRGISQLPGRGFSGGPRG